MYKLSQVCLDKKCQYSIIIWYFLLHCNYDYTQVKTSSLYGDTVTKLFMFQSKFREKKKIPSFSPHLSLVHHSVNQWTACCPRATNCTADSGHTEEHQSVQRTNLSAESNLKMRRTRDFCQNTHQSSSGSLGQHSPACLQLFRLFSSQNTKTWTHCFQCSFWNTLLTCLLQDAMTANSQQTSVTSVLWLFLHEVS